MKGRRKTNLVPISKVLQDSQKKTQAVFATSGLRKQWASIVGQMLSNQTRPKKIDRNILWISVQHSALNYELSLMKPMILDKIFDVTGTRFKDLKFIQEPIQASNVEENEPSRKKFERAIVDESESIDTILDKLKSMSKDLQKNRKQD